MYLSYSFYGNTMRNAIDTVIINQTFWQIDSRFGLKWQIPYNQIMLWPYINDMTHRDQSIEKIRQLAMNLKTRFSD